MIRAEAEHAPSAFPGCIDIPVNFDGSWKTRGFYFNMGFGSAISALTKKVLDYELLNPICEKCYQWSAKREKNTQMNSRSGMTTTKPIVKSTIRDPASQWSQLLLS